MENIISLIAIKFYGLILLVLFVLKCNGWKAVPANQASFALRQLVTEVNEGDDPDLATLGDSGADGVPDELLPRNVLQSTYKFGWCTRDVIKHQYLRKEINMTMGNIRDLYIRYIYLLERRHTQRYAFQCIIMKLYTPRKYLFRKSRLPMYYCQGQAHFLIMNTIQRLEIHEFYISTLLLQPTNFRFEFYHAPPQ